MFNVIVAHDKNQIIGNKLGLPWHFHEDLRYFREKTMSDGPNVLIMGRNTFESLPPLEGRDIIVVTSRDTLSEDNVTTVDSIHSLMSYLSTKNYNHHFVIGGGSFLQSLFQYYSDHIDRMYLTFIHGEFCGDTHFPRIDLDRFYLKEFRTQKCTNKNDGKDYQLDFISLFRHDNAKGERQYIDLVKEVIQEGTICRDRTGVGVYSEFGKKMEFDLSVGYPLLTTKKVFFRGIVEELLWFLSGSTDTNVLKKKNVHIWDDNTNRSFLDQNGLSHYEDGDGGPIYGFQFRHFGDTYLNCRASYRGFDQVNYVLHLIKTEPWSRRMVINLWDPTKLDQMVLPPCHMTYHFRVEKNDRLSCVFYQRSADIALGVPFNIASAALFVHIMAFLSGKKVGRLIHFLGDVHVYRNHVDALEKQWQNPIYYFPVLEIQPRQQKVVEDFQVKDFELKGYRGTERISMSMAV